MLTEVGIYYNGKAPKKVILPPPQKQFPPMFPGPICPYSHNLYLPQLLAHLILYLNTEFDPIMSDSMQIDQIKSIQISN